MIKAYAAQEPGGQLMPMEYDPGPLRDSDVEIDVEFCGICHSDLSMLDNEWGISEYPLVPGHEVIGRVAAIGSAVKSVKVGQQVGLGWFASSCMMCEWCLSGNHNLCPNAEQTIVGRHGGFADKVRAHEVWAIPLPDGIDATKAGPLFCGGITVFNPIIQSGIMPTDRVGVIGIGGLGHMALQFLRAWGCEVTAFSSSPEKTDEAQSMGAHHVVNSRDPEALGAIANSLDAIISTVSADLDWSVYINALRPKGRLHFVGVAPSPISTHVFPLIAGQKSLSATPLGSPANTATMLDFTQRHSIEPIIETFPFSQINEAMEKLRSGKPRYRIVLTPG
ncbi:NADPH-dependent aldehyde reductase Ahr [Leptolyngbya iicbica]|uniref:alcohol dehydrogenase (NADP(+)) n=2 Tax=Cyanophyceae TaxID=3028117 RepID=A0A4Q7E1G1_9CYAN|nr:NAD(P)-dependent alcohol dehydrogenase [Leptolyngbya sp. LK]RZM75363.1 NAD(P)-dependent alcohol dehydrogenase [Leptolyngbya sp. LK]